MKSSLSGLFGVYKAEITKYLSDYFNSKEKTGENISHWAVDVPRRLLKLSLGGKMIRGSLVMLSHEMFGGTGKNNAVIAASAIELFESACLIHDDIIDRDIQRRGM